MQTIQRKNIKDIAPYDGPYKIPGIRFRAVREALGVTAWGMNVLELDADCQGYPEHNHKEDRQEELYLVLEGQLTLKTQEGEQELTQGDMVRVPPDVTRTFITGKSGAALLAIGGTPGQAYEVKPGM